MSKRKMQSNVEFDYDYDEDEYRKPKKKERRREVKNWKKAWANNSDRADEFDDFYSK